MVDFSGRLRGLCAGCGGSSRPKNRGADNGLIERSQEHTQQEAGHGGRKLFAFEARANAVARATRGPALSARLSRLRLDY